ncbi:MAG: glycosyltransferase family 4 protein [Candidatus Zhuqueibacterota bacterium]
MKKFLFITYYFPPAGGPSVQRIIRIIQHMTGNGWEPVVLTVKNGDYTSLDSSLEKVIPSQVKIIRTEIFEPYNFYRAFLGKKKDEKIPLAVLSANKKAGWREKIANFIRANFFIPDGRIGWYGIGVRAGIRAIKDNPDIAIILSSGPPHTVHLIARKIAQKTGLPFVADFRDPWVNIEYYSDIKRSALTVAADRWLEGKVLRSADATVAVSPGCVDLLIQGRKNLDRRRFHVIYNGFDPDAFPAKIPNPPRDTFVITYIGNLPYSRLTPVFYQAVANLKSSGKIAPGSFQIRFYGNIDSTARQALSAFQIDDILAMHNFIPHQQAIEKICQSHLLLLVINNSATRKAIVTGKLFEYLASQRYILAVGPTDGDAAHILNDTGVGSMFDYDDLPGIQNFLFSQYRHWQAGQWQPSHTDRIGAYLRAEQLKQLEAIFQNLTGSS